MQEPINWPKGVKKTRQRSLVYQVLERTQAPVTAMEVSTALERAGTPVWLSTIYRVLDAFAERDMVQKTPGMDGGMALYELSRQGHKHYAVCVRCRGVTPLEGCPLEIHRPRLADGDFEVTGHRLQIYGYCRTCRETKKK